MSRQHRAAGGPDTESGPLPVIIAERCVHARVEVAGCRACISACPREAWFLGDDALALDTEACDGCGLCAAVCPESALLHRHEPLRRDWGDSAVALAGCERAAVSDGRGIIPCLHAFGIRDLLLLYRDGVRRFIAFRGNCDDCARGRGRRLEAVATQTNVLLTSRGLAPLTYEEESPRQWTKTAASGLPGTPGPSMGRRSFLRRSVKVAVEEGMKMSGLAEAEANQPVPPGKLVGHNAAGHIACHVPRIKPECCTGCDACARLCHHEAITLVTREGEAQYRLEADACTGCGICADVCEHGAVSVGSMEMPAEKAVPLRQAHCAACGAAYHVPYRAGEASQRCPICLRAPHRAMLYQVLP